jgi:hypothetical protein
MQRSALHCVVAAALLAAVAAPVWADVKVSFTEPQKFADIGKASWERDDAMRHLTAHFQALAKRYLPAGQDLTVEVTDVDLAGRQDVSFRHPELRVVRSIDWPSISFSYSVTADGKTVQQGTERLSDMGFDTRLRTAYSGEPLYYEQRMLEDWFRAKFVTQSAKAK